MAYKLLLSALLAAMAVPAQAKTYRWVDAQGKVHYTDTLPPDTAGRGNMEINQSGSLVKRGESVEEKKAREAREAEAAKKKSAEAEQARKDRALLATYTTEQEIDLARSRALEHHNLAIKSARVRLDPLQKQANSLTASANKFKASGKPMPQHAQQQLQSVMGEVEQLRGTIKSNEDSLVAVNARYDAEKQRFRELKGIKPAAQAPANPEPPAPAKPAAQAPAKPAMPAPTKP